MAWDDGLQGVHRQIASDVSGSIHVLAGPGTGKTYAMMRRLARLLEENVPAAELLAVTFTRTAAKDLQEQLGSLGIQNAAEVRATTLHSLCFGALARDDVFRHTGRVARPLLSYEIEQMLLDLAGQFGGKKAVRALLEAYEAGWARLQREEPGFAQTDLDRDFETALLDWLKFHRSMLIGELVPLALRYVRSNPTLELFPRFSHVLVDEYQDLNRADQALVLELARRGQITVIGDDNQSIYRFRHANPEGIRDYPQEHRPTASYQIRECRRCPPNVVEMSNNLIAHDSARLRSQPLIALPERPDAEVYIVQHKNLEQEAHVIAAYVRNYLRENTEIPPGQVLILSPRQFMGQRIKRSLIEYGLNALSYFYEDELRTKAAAEGFCLLTLVVRPDDRAAFRSWLGLRSATGLSGSYRRLRNAAQAENLEPRALLDQVRAGTVRLAHSGALLLRYETLLDRLAEIAPLLRLELVRSLWPEEDESVQDLRLAAQRLALTYPEPAGLLDALQQEITQPQLPSSQDDIIRIMSLHKSKGLTAKVVVIVGCLAGAIPSLPNKGSEAEKDSALAEQRRLFYVATTRATDELVLSASTSMLMRDAMAGGVAFGAVTGRGPLARVRTTMSPFIDELGGAAPQPITTAEFARSAGFEFTE